MTDHIMTMDDLIRALRDRRRALGLSQIAVDDMAGLPTGYTAKIEAVLTNPTAKNARAIGRESLPLMLGALGVSLAVHSAAMQAKSDNSGNDLACIARKNFIEMGRRGAIRRWARMTDRERKAYAAKLHAAKRLKARLRRREQAARPVRPATTRAPTPSDPASPRSRPGSCNSAA